MSDKTEKAPVGNARETVLFAVYLMLIIFKVLVSIIKKTAEAVFYRIFSKVSRTSAGQTLE